MLSTISNLENCRTFAKRTAAHSFQCFPSGHRALQWSTCKVLHSSELRSVERLCSTRVRSQRRHTLELRLSVCVYYTGTEQVCGRCEPPITIVIITVITITMQRSCGEASSWSEGAGALVSCDTRLLRPVGGAAPAQGPSSPCGRGPRHPSKDTAMMLPPPWA